MPDVSEKKDLTTPVAPAKQHVDLRPQLKRPPAPRIYRWIQWMAVFGAFALAGVMAVVLLNGDDAATEGPVGQEAEHGAFTPYVAVDRPGPAAPIFVGTNPPDLDQ